ncbi:MAG: EpsG family protein [Lutibacter sp.]|uniref:EpsG family protein n=1 Tax=Lutibacter sp. TaxID=1925666 RepID=UPI00299DA330|nr:EpsG family protein [Lutibacter sp.]MDX1828783.1 EpsG family protein [Lutibacter sp.]
MIYFLILILLIFFAFIYDFGNAKSGKKIAYYGILLVLICLSSFRYRVGGDTLMYMLKYQNMPNFNEFGNYEIGLSKLQPLWVLLVAIAKSITPEFYMLQILHAIIVNSLIFSFIKSNTKYVFTAILLYYIGYYGYFNFEILRESIAIGIFLYSIKYLQNKKWFLYFTLSFVAFLFHFSAIILFIFPFIINLKFSFWRALLIFVLGILFSSYFSRFVDSVNLVGGLITSMKEYVEYVPTIWGIISILVLYLLYPTVIYKLSKSFLKINSNFYSFLSVYIIIGAAATFFFIFFRFLNYLTPIIFIFLTEILHGFFRRKDIRSIRMAFVIIIFLIFSIIHMNRYFTDTSKYVASSRWYSYWYPYYSIFDKKKDETRENLIRAQNNLN